MTGVGRKGKVGHLHRDVDDSPSYCGRVLGTGRFTDAAAEPAVCRVCLRIAIKARDCDHTHVVFFEGAWWVRFILRQTWYSIGAITTSVATKCPEPDCARLVEHHAVVSGFNTGTTSSNYIWSWAA